MVALYPSPAGATESELDLGAWDTLCAANPILDRLEPDAEALVVDRTSPPHVYAIVPVDQAYRLVGLVKERWEGISGGRGVQEAVAEYFEACVWSVVRSPSPAASTPSSRSSASSRSRTPRRRRCASTRTSTTRRGARSTRSRSRPRSRSIPRAGTYDAETRERLVELFGPPERWASTTEVFRWAHVSALVPGFTGATSFAIDVPCTYDMEIAASKYFYSLLGRRGPALVPVQRDGALQRRGRPAAGRAGAVELHGQVADAGRRLEGRHGRVLPRRRLGAGHDRRRSTRSPRARPRAVTTATTA